MKFSLLLSLLICSPAYCQPEFLHQKGDHSISYSADIVGNKLFFTATEKTGLGGGVLQSTLYLADENLQLLDSINIDQSFSMTQSLVSGIKSYKDSIAIVSVSNTGGNPHPHENLVLFVDTNLNVLDTIRYLPHSVQDTFLQLQNFEIVDAMLFTSNYMQGTSADSNAYPNLRLFDINTKQEVASYNYYNISNTPFNNITKFNSQYICTLGWFLSPYPFLTLNSDFTYDTAYISGGFNPPIHYRIDNFLYSGTDYLYTAGLINGVFAGVVKFDKQLEVAKIDTAFVREMIVDQRGCIDYATLDNIFIGVGQNNNIDGSPFIHVFNVDTAGNFHWHKKIFQDSSVRFILWEVVATPDGGAFLISSKYDPRYKQQLHHRISIIKIDSAGGVVAEREWALPSAFSLYPNPARDFVKIEGLENHQKLNARVFDLKGETVLETKLGQARQLNVAELPTGTYLLQLSNEDGKRQTEKLVVE